MKYSVQYGPNILVSTIYCKNHHFIPYERISELFNDVIGIKICSATIIKAERECFRNMEYFENTVKEKLIAFPVLHCDETGMKVQGKKHWLHVASNDKYTCYFAHPKRGSEAMDSMGILPEYKGIAVHDGWKPYNGYDCTHALCNAYLQRELIGIEENYKHQWAKDINKAVN